MAIQRTASARLLTALPWLLLTALAVLALGSLAGCDRRAAMNALVDHAVDAQARQDFELLGKHDPALLARLVPEAQSGDAPAQFAKMTALLPATPVDQHLIGYNVWIVNGDTRYDLTYEARRQDNQFPWVLEHIRLHRTGDGLSIEGMNVTTLARSVEELNAFTLAHRPLWMLAYLGGMVLVATFILVTLAVCARERGLRRKWAWLLFVALGVGVVDLNWSNGVTAYEIGVALLGAGAESAGVAGPWVFKLGFPLGAIVYWVRRRRLRNTASSDPSVAKPLDPIEPMNPATGTSADGTA